MNELIGAASKHGHGALIHSEDAVATAERCKGPDRLGWCPRVRPGQPVACAGRWITANGWDFKVAQEADRCPLATLGLIVPAR